MEDKLLIWKLNRGSTEALHRIHEKYRDDMVRIAAGLSGNMATAEDVVQEVFLMLVRSAGNVKVKKNLKGYLTTCVVNRIRNLARPKKSQTPVSLDSVEPGASNSKSPVENVICDEQSQLIYDAIATLPYKQKEAVLLRTQAGLKFKEIAKLQDVSTKTSLSRYNYGLDKLRSMLNKSEVSK